MTRTVLQQKITTMDDAAELSIKLFATLKERARAASVTVAMPTTHTTVRKLRKLIAMQHPALAALVESSVVSINLEFAFNDDAVKAGDEVALFPPVSGGSDYPTHLAITHDAIKLDELQQLVTTELDGSVVLFIGTVRKVTGQETTTHLEYEAYQVMAEAKLAQVAEEMRAKFPGVHGIALVQRIGHMPAGEPTVAVACSCSHRGDGAFEAARYGIDRIKQIVTVWKRETRPDGSSWIEGDYAPTPDD